MTKKETDFEQMVREHKSTIYTVCYMFSQDSDEINDLFQEVLINLWKGFDGFRGESKVDTWIWRIALNTCISDDRKKKRRGERGRLCLRDFLGVGLPSMRRVQLVVRRSHHLDDARVRFLHVEVS